RSKSSKTGSAPAHLCNELWSPGGSRVCAFVAPPASHDKALVAPPQRGSMRSHLASAAPETQASPCVAIARRGASLGRAVRRGAAANASMRFEAEHCRHAAGSARRAHLRRAERARLALPAARVAVHGMVLARRRARLCDSVLSRASALDGARAAADARGGRRDHALLLAAHAARDG